MSAQVKRFGFAALLLASAGLTPPAIAAAQASELFSISVDGQQVAGTPRRTPHSPRRIFR